MANLWQVLTGRRASDQSAVSRYSFSDYANEKLEYFSFGGMQYPLLGFTQMGQKVEEIENNFAGYCQGAYKSNGVIFAVSLARHTLFSEVRFAWQDISGARPGELTSTPELDILRYPWPNGTTGDMLGRAEQDVTNAGNFFLAREGGRLRRLRPDWVSIILTAPPDEAVESDVAGFLYRAGGIASKGETRIYLPEECAHWAPIADPEAMFRGMSWLTPVVREIRADSGATLHKLKFFENAATPNLSVAFKETVTEDQFKAFVDAMNASHQGVRNAYKTLYVGGGADVNVIGSDLKQLDFKATQGAGETRIAAAGRVPPIIVGLSEGLSAATYSNYSSARRAFGDGWARNQWRSIAAALESIVIPPRGSRLWYDDRDIPFLREDQRDAAAILKEQMLAVEAGVRAGFEPDTIVDAVASGDLTKMRHTGLYSVQLQPPGTEQQTPTQSTGGDDGNAS